jgi:membrane-bound serine protease (ClpP class)
MSLRRTAAVLFLSVGVLLMFWATPARADSTLSTELPQVRVIQLGGFLDPTSIAYLTTQVEAAQATNALAIIIQINSRGGTVGERELADVVTVLRDSPVPVAVWLGPTNSRVYGDAVQILAGADVVGMAQGARVGRPQSTIDVNGVRVEPSDDLRVEDARSRGLVDVSSPTLVEFIRTLNGQTLKGTTLQVSSDGKDLFVPVFTKPTLMQRLMHVVTSPIAALFFVTVGLLLIVFEFFAAAAGVVGVCGAACFALGSYGVAELGVRPVGVALYVVALLLVCSDLQSGPVRGRAVAGMVLFGAAGALLFSSYQPSVLAQLVVWIPQTAFVLLGIPVMIRTRFSTSVLPRQELIGQTGVAPHKFGDTGVVVIDDVTWIAKVNAPDAPISAGAEISVHDVDQHHVVVRRAHSASISG